MRKLPKVVSPHKVNRHLAHTEKPHMVEVAPDYKNSKCHVKSILEMDIVEIDTVNRRRERR